MDELDEQLRIRLCAGSNENVGELSVSRDLSGWQWWQFDAERNLIIRSDMMNMMIIRLELQHSNNFAYFC
jgi:hypothetical protein